MSSPKRPRPRMSVGPSEPPPKIDDAARREFVGGAKATTAKPAPKKKPSPAKGEGGPLPWETANTGPRSVQIRTTEKMALQLQYLKDQGHIQSFYSFAIDAVQRAIDERLKEEGVI